MPVTIYLRDLNQTLVEAWQRCFAACPDVKPSAGHIFDIRADAIVSPANSFGFMDGGIDYTYSVHLGWHVQDRLREILRHDHNGELPVGMAVLLPTDHADYPYLISAPTMRVPENVSGTINAYLAFRAALRVVLQANKEQPGMISSVLCPGLGTAVGHMSPQTCAWQMHTAYQKIFGDQSRPPANLDAAAMDHFHLLRPQ